ncbi:MAG: hypothetical protein DMG00_18840 [Acidobacteria bacterium]|nr:MAG: hypothetical protein DMG00_18840 [Acidobacteriota bacterium]
MRESAYAYEIRGTRSRQARENLKKLRAMIRRAENRGYQTLARVADHLERLAVGDESNAPIDASDAVSLMTVHAAKGLEFPIVFVVNMGRGAGGVRPPIRVSAGADSATSDASVSIADYQSEADEETSAREREETKRLLSRPRSIVPVRIGRGRRVSHRPRQPRRGVASERQGDVRARGRLGPASRGGAAHLRPQVGEHDRRGRFRVTIFTVTIFT